MVGALFSPPANEVSLGGVPAEPVRGAPSPRLCPLRPSGPPSPTSLPLLDGRKCAFRLCFSPGPNESRIVE